METNIPEFGIKRENEERRDGGCGVVYDPQSKKYAVGRHYEDGSFRLFSGGVDPKENLEEGITREVVEESGLYDFDRIEKLGAAFAHYYNPLRKVNRVTLSTCYLFILKTPDTKPVHLEEHEKFSLAWATAAEILADWTSHNENKDHDHWIYFFKKGIERVRELHYND